MDAKNFFDSFKDFFWDILGYLLPGLYLFFLLSVCIVPERFYTSEILKSQPELYLFALIVVCYILGYLIYGVGVLKDRFFGKYSSTRKIEQKTKDKAEFKLSKEIAKKYIADNNLTTVIPDDIKTRDLRNIVMGFVPEVDNKTYTFMFRSDLCKHISNTSLIIGILGLLNALIEWKWIHIPLFKVEINHIILYSILIVSYFLFRATRNYFYSIALKIPFSAYITKVK